MEKQDPGGKGQYRAGEVIVKFKPGTSKEAVQDLALKYRLELIRPLTSPDVYLFRAKADANMEELLRDLGGSPLIEYAEPNFIYKPSSRTP